MFSNITYTYLRRKLDLLIHKRKIHLFLWFLQEEIGRIMIKYTYTILTIL